MKLLAAARAAVAVVVGLVVAVVGDVEAAGAAAGNHLRAVASMGQAAPDCARRGRRLKLKTCLTVDRSSEPQCPLCRIWR